MGVPFKRSLNMYFAESLKKNENKKVANLKLQIFLVSMTSLLVHTVAQPTKQILAQEFEPDSYFCD